jgi:hypothetical protein
LGQAFTQRAQIKPGAADQDRQAARRQRCRDLGKRQFAPRGRRSPLGSIEKTVEAMRRPRLLGWARSRGENAQVAIRLQRVGVDDRAAVVFGQRQREGRFPARGRPGDDDDGVLVQLGASFEASLRKAPQDEDGLWMPSRKSLILSWL